MQRRHDDFERRARRKFRMHFHWNAAAVVGHRHIAVCRKLDLDAGGMAGDRLIHRVIDDLGEQVVQRIGIGTADIHARAAAYRLEPFEHLDVGRRIAAAIGRGRRHGGRADLGGDGFEGRGRAWRRLWLRLMRKQVIALRHAGMEPQQANRVCSTFSTIAGRVGFAPPSGAAAGPNALAALPSTSHRRSSANGK